MKKEEKILIFLVLSLVGFFGVFKFTKAYLSDKEQILGNSIQVGVWGITPTEVPLPGAPTPTPTEISPTPTETLLETPTPTNTQTPTPTLVQKIIYLNHLGEDIANQYGYNHDYSTAVNNNVSFTYNTPLSGKLNGSLQATGLKPYATYQVKLSGIPTCSSGSGNDAINEYIGYKGRWTCASSNCSGQSAEARNRTDAQYEANKAKSDSDSSKECLAGYLVFDYITADGSGSASKLIETANSYHVLWCGGGTCDTKVNNSLSYPDASHGSLAFCSGDKVNGEIERLTCGGLTLNADNYSLKMSLTEESFHQGDWAEVLLGDINFETQ